MKLLRDFNIPWSNLQFDADTLLELIQKNDELATWDVAIPRGDGKTSPKWHENYEPQERVSRSKYRVISDGLVRVESLTSQNYFKEGIYDASGEYDESEVKRLEEVERDAGKKSGKDAKTNKVNIEAYFRTDKRRPLLLIYPLEFKKTIDRNGNEVDLRLPDDVTPLAISLGFPSYPSSSDDPYGGPLVAKYKVNKIYERMGMPEDDADEEVEDE